MNRSYVFSPAIKLEGTIIFNERRTEINDFIEQCLNNIVQKYEEISEKDYSFDRECLEKYIFPYLFPKMFVKDGEVCVGVRFDPDAQPYVRPRIPTDTDRLLGPIVGSEQRYLQFEHKRNGGEGVVDIIDFNSISKLIDSKPEIVAVIEFTMNVLDCKAFATIENLDIVYIGGVFLTRKECLNLLYPGLSIPESRFLNSIGSLVCSSEKFEENALGDEFKNAILIEVANLEKDVPSLNVAVGYHRLHRVIYDVEHVLGLTEFAFVLYNKGMPVSFLDGRERKEETRMMIPPLSDIEAVKKTFFKEDSEVFKKDLGNEVELIIVTVASPEEAICNKALELIASSFYARK